jgi:hypothetical protein
MDNMVGFGNNFFSSVHQLEIFQGKEVTEKFLYFFRGIFIP